VIVDKSGVEGMTGQEMTLSRHGDLAFPGGKTELDLALGDGTRMLNKRNSL